MTAPPLRISEIPATQRAALAWRLRNAIANADGKGALEPGPGRWLTKHTALRGHVLMLISEMEVGE